METQVVRHRTVSKLQARCLLWITQVQTVCGDQQMLLKMGKENHHTSMSPLLWLDRRMIAALGFLRIILITIIITMSRILMDEIMTIKEGEEHSYKLSNHPMVLEESNQQVSFITITTLRSTSSSNRRRTCINHRTRMTSLWT